MSVSETSKRVENFWRKNTPDEIHDYLVHNLQQRDDTDGTLKGMFMAIMANYRRIESMHDKLDTIMALAKWGMPTFLTAVTIFLSIAFAL